MCLLSSLSLTVLAAKYYTVSKGDTLYLIARKLGTTVTSLKAANNLTSDVIYPGQTLIIPGKTSETTGSQQRYTVQPGDTLWLLSVKFGVSIAALKSANGLTSDYLYVGQVLVIPTGGATAPPPASQTTYQVTAGDSLFLIGQRFGVTVDALKRANNLTSEIIYVGQILRIPSSAPPETPVPPPPSEPTSQTVYLHQVKWGESLESIAQHYRVESESLVSVNMLPSPTVDSWMALIVANPASGFDDLLTVSIPKNMAVSDFHKLARMTYAEAGAEPYDGQVAVAAVILNRVEDPYFPNTVEGVLTQPYQFEPISNGYYYQTPPSLTAYKAALDAVNGVDPTDGALYFYNPSVISNKWLLSKPVTYTIGSHAFAR